MSILIVGHPPKIDMGWLGLVGFFKLQVSFAKYRLFHRALLRKRPMILRLPLDSSEICVRVRMYGVYYI